MLRSALLWSARVESRSPMRLRRVLPKLSPLHVVVIDDFMQELTKDVSLLFSTFSHHLNVTVFLLAQNLFLKNPVFRDISLNATYHFIFKNP